MNLHNEVIAESLTNLKKEGFDVRESDLDMVAIADEAKKRVAQSLANFDKSNQIKLDFLTDTYTQWLLQENIYERVCASDLRYGSYDLSDEQNQWLETFIEIWDIIAEVD